MSSDKTSSAGTKRRREAEDLSRAIGDSGWTGLTNQFFGLGQLTTALMERNRLRLELQKKDNEVASILGSLKELPQASFLVDATEKEYHRILNRLQEEKKKEEGPKKKKARSSSSKSAAPAEVEADEPISPES